MPDLAAPARLPTLHRVELHARALDLLLPARLHPATKPRLRDDECAVPEPDQSRGVRVTLPIRMQLRGGRTEICGSADRPVRCDASLIAALRTTHAMLQLDADGLPILPAAPASSYTRRLVRLALLAPDLQRAILAGRQPAGLSLTRFLRTNIPLDWSGQRHAF